MENEFHTAVFGGGCFWCTEAVFKKLRGVVSVAPGYSGGEAPNPSYEEVCTGNTGHVEVVKIGYDPARISFHDLLEVFFATHDPTTIDRQGNDVGSEYASVIFYTSEEQKAEAEKFVRILGEQEIYDSPVVTRIEPLKEFYQAEDFHHDYFAKNPRAAYCQIVINPKLEKFKQRFGELLR